MSHNELKTMTMTLAVPFRFPGRSRPLRPVGRRPLGWTVALIASLLMVTGCEETVVTTVAVDQVRITPEQTQLSIGSSLRLTAELLDRGGNPIRGLAVAWSSEDQSVVEVNDEGVVTARSVGNVLIQATGGGKSGTATIEVVRPAAVSLHPDSVPLTATVGSSDQPTGQVSIRNTGDEPLESLEVAVSYPDAEPTGWLVATLSYSAADTLVTLLATPGSLEQGTYSAAVLVFADESSARIKVTLEMEPGPPSGPSDLVARVEDDAVRLSWSDNSADEREFRIERRSSNETGFTVLGTVEADVTAYTDASVEGDRSYRYRVRACGEGGCSAPSNEASVSMPPLAPSELSAQALSATEIELEWVDHAASEEEFEIQRKTNGSDFSPLTRVGANATSFTDTNLDPGTTYSYRVQACNAGGCSEFAGPATATTLDPPAPAAPSNLQARVVAGKLVKLSWLDNSYNEAEFRIYRGESSGSYGQIDSVAADETSYTDEPGEGTYYYVVAACTADDVCAESNEIEVEVDDD